MKICAVTMVHQDYWALGQWYRHYGCLLGAEHLFVVAHGPDRRIPEICPAASVITIPRQRLQGFDHWRGRMLNRFQQGLLEVYDWVIRTDADELVHAGPGHPDGLPGLLARQEAPALFALGVNLYEAGPGHHAVFTGHYSKAWAFREPLGLRRHGVEMRPRRLGSFPFVMPREVYLAHLKYACRNSAAAMTPARAEVAHSGGPGNPGKAWREAAAETRRQYAKVAALPARPWAEAEAEAWAALQEPVRDSRISVLRAKSLRFGCRSSLPDWFAPPGAQAPG